MVSLAGTLSRIESKHIFVAGDYVLDTYTIGSARRISPEAPVAIVHAREQIHRPGGAGNVALNLLSLGQQVTCLGRVGNDPNGTLLAHTLAQEGAAVSGLWVEPNYMTHNKNRIIAENQQIVRVDHEEIKPIAPDVEQTILAQLPSLLKRIDVIAISDYGKGFLTPGILSFLIQWGRKKKIPVIVDPKGHFFDKYRGATWLKPNLEEAYTAAMLPKDAPLEEVAKELFSITKSHVLMITSGAKGLALFIEGENRQDYPVTIREVKDVTGAGDTVFAMVACCLANDIPLRETALYCNLSGGLSVEHLGCARITLADVAWALLKEDAHNKVFEEEHLFALQKAEEGREWVLLSLGEEEPFCKEVLQMILQQKKRSKADLVVAVSKKSTSSEWVDLLSSLKEVDFVILHEQKIDILEQILSPTTTIQVPPFAPANEVT